MVTKIERWKTEDGMEFLTEEEAIRWEERGKAESQLSKLIAEDEMYDMTTEDLLLILTDRAEEYIRLLTPFVKGI